MAAVEPVQIPLPTNSMVTVRLSDAQIHPEPFPDIVEEEVDIEDAQAMSEPSTRTSSTSSRRSSSSSATNSVNWEGLEKTEEQEPKHEGTDESTALLLARLEQENNALAHDPKSALATTTRSRCDTRARPPSIHYLKKLVSAPQKQSLRYSLLPAPPMTELEFWAALVKDYRQTCQRLPTLTTNKIRGGVPPPLRGVVWPAIAGAHDGHLHSEYQRLSAEPSPYDGLIGKDVGRSFPNVDMFREKDGDGQRMLGRVLKAFSLYDDKIGYCQGLGFVVGPLLMHMSEPEAFCVLVRLMDHYDLRSCYTPDLAGLHLRIYQFQALLSRSLPDLAAHLLHLKIEPIYISQWFLSFFAVTCPLPMLLRIYDVILSEGATETLMRVALSLMQRNEKKLLGFTEFEDAMQFLLSRSLWDTYAQHADQMVTDFVSLTGLVTRESLQSLESDYRQAQIVPTTSSLKSAATSLLGRFWTGASHNASKSANLSLTIPINPLSAAKRKMSTSNSLKSNTVSTSAESATSELSTVPTEMSDTPRAKSDDLSIISAEVTAQNISAKDRDLHSQIEELVMAMNKLQHQQLEMARELQREREERSEERNIASSLLTHLQKQQKAVKELVGTDDVSEEEIEIEELVGRALITFADQASRRQSILVSKHQLREDVASWKEKHDAEAARCRDLMKQLDDREAQHNDLKENLKDARSRVQDSQREKQRLERTIQDLRSRSPATPDSPDLYTPVSEIGELKLPPSKGLREFRLGRPDSVQRSPTTNSMSFGKRTSSLNVQAVIENSQPAASDTLLAELVHAKTAEALAKQELEETKGKLESLRKILSGPVSSPNIKPVTSNEVLSSSPTSTPSEIKPAVETPKAVTAAHAPSSSIGGFFSGWGKRS